MRILRADDIGICWANEIGVGAYRLLHDDIGFFFSTILSQLLSHFPVVSIYTNIYIYMLNVHKHTHTHHIYI